MDRSLSDLEERILTEIIRRDTTLEVCDVDRIEYSFPVPVVPSAKTLPVWSTNTRLSVFPEAALRKAWRRSSYAAGRNLDPITGLWLFTMELPFRTNQRRDPMNYVGTVLKAVADGLTDAQVWPDDTPEYVRVLDPDIVIMKPPDWVRVRLLKIATRIETEPCLFD